MARSQQFSAPFGFNLIGFASANLGLGTALRNTAAILKANGFPFCILDVDLGDGRSHLDPSLRSHFHPPGHEAPYAVNLFHMNPPELAGLLGASADKIPVAGRMNVGVPFWELPLMPPSWTKLLSGMDMVLAPSRFIQAGLAMHLESTPIRYYQQSIGDLPYAQGDRARWGFPAGAAVFLSSFDLSSDLFRKNPTSTMLAFQNAFSGSKDALLVIKLNNAALNPQAVSATRKLKMAAESMGNVLILDRNLPYADLISLYASADIFVSLHRGEGLGLSLMESMWLGKPVICTDWSGNMDYCDDLNCCLVGHSLTRVHPDSPYRGLLEGVEQDWAEPEMEQAVDWMRKLADRPQLRREIGDRASASIRAFLAQAREGSVFRHIQAYYESRWGGPQPLSVLIQNREDMEGLPGGDTIVTHHMLTGLRDAGLAAEISLDTSPALGDWDVVQLVNISRTRESLRQMRHARNAGKPAVVLSLYEDFDRYLIPAVKASMVYELVAREQRQCEPEMLLHLAKNAAISMNPLDQDVSRHLGIGDKQAQQEILSGASAVLTSGKSEQDLLRAKFRFDAPMFDIPFGVDPSLRNARGNAFTDKYGLKDFALCIGRLEPRKNTWSLIEIFRQWPTKQLVLIGHFDSSSREKAVRAYAPPNVFFLPRLPRQEMISALAAARVHVLPSWYELPGLVTLEAAAAGTRVVTTSWGTAKDCLGERVHYCEPDNPDSIRRAILTAWDTPPHPELRDFVLGTYHWKKTATRLREVYESVLSAHRATPVAQMG